MATDRAAITPLKLSDPHRAMTAATAAKGGLTAESTSAGRAEAGEESPLDAPGLRAVYVPAVRGADRLETPVFLAEDRTEAVAVFTDRSKLIAYLQTARWFDTHEPAELSAAALGELLCDAREDGVGMVVLNPDRHAHLQGEPQYTVALGEDISGEGVMRQLSALEDERRAEAGG